MKKHLTVLALVLSVGAVAAALASASPANTAAAAASRDLRTTAKLTFAHSVDRAPRGPSAGDVNVFGGRLIGPDVKGRYQAYCVAVSRTSQECTETLATPSGQIAAQAAYGRGGTALTPIVGGSGSYAGVRGDMAERETHGGREVNLVLHLQQ